MKFFADYMYNFSDISTNLLGVMAVIVLLLAFDLQRRAAKEGLRPAPAEEKSKSPPDIRQLANSSLSGFIRGGLTGALVNGAAGAFTGGLIFAVINPLVLELEAYHIGAL